MTRWALLLEYDGTPFVGWQRQVNGLSVQEVLERAAAHLNASRPVASIVAGRTDAGVHAEGQVAHIELPDGHRAKTVREALNYHMKPHPVVVLAAVPVTDDWNARFAADRRSYRYRILDRPSRPALMVNRVWHVPNTLDAAAMHAAGQHLLGRHDFTSFRAASCQAKSPVRTLDRLDVTRRGDIVEVVTAARSFLHHQVRNFVGTLKLVGNGHWPVEHMITVLEAKDRAAAGPTAPSAGLTLIGVGYPDDPFRPGPYPGGPSPQEPSPRELFPGGLSPFRR
jgi:tRNA pseudouridine38-40 synthase